MFAIIYFRIGLNFPKFPNRNPDPGNIFSGFFEILKSSYCTEETISSQIVFWDKRIIHLFLLGRVQKCTVFSENLAIHRILNRIWIPTLNQTSWFLFHFLLTLWRGAMASKFTYFASTAQTLGCNIFGR